MKNNNLLSQSAPDESLKESQEDQALVPHKTDWIGIGQIAFSGLAAVTLLGFSLISAVAALFQKSFSPLTSGGTDLSSYLFAAGLGGMGILMVPSAFWAGRRLFGGGEPRQVPWGGLALLGYSFPFLILLGYGIQTGPDWSGGFLPMVHVLANLAGVLLLLDLALRKLPGQSASRFWGTFAAGLGMTPLVTFFLEIMILFGIGLVWTVLLGALPAFRQELVDLANLFQNSSINPQDLQSAIGDFAVQPGVLFTLFGYVAFLIPLVEEIFKTAAVWLLLGQQLQPREGFVLGATSGAGYALFENLTIGSAADMWTFITLTRLGTAAVHIFTAGLVGWGLVWAFGEKKYGRLAAAFFGAGTLHGIWNGLNILSAVGGFAAVQRRLGSLGSSLADFAPVALLLLALGCVGGILKANKYFRRAIMAGIH